MRAFAQYIFITCILLATACNPKDLPIARNQVDYNFDVKPILVQNCYLCHGPDPSSREAGLRLDTYEGATAWLEDSVRAIVPGNSSQSELLSRINHRDPDIMMPPPESNFTLTGDQIDILEKWIEQGAQFEEHWSFIPPVPNDHSASTPQEVIDELIAKKLTQKGLDPSPIANKHTLIRRVSFVLTGLPPTQSEIEKYVEDQNENAYETMVDYYLSSPSFGERWARHWLDVVRYAETRGHEFDFEIYGAWQYRDYLIRAFNSDLPYDQFVMEHLAGDLLNEQRSNPETGFFESQLATAFFTLSEGTHSPVDIRKDEADRIDNIIDVTSKTFQGLTVACARCHDHKFDPIPTADYYSMYGMIESTRFSPLATNMSIERLRNISALNDLYAQAKTSLNLPLRAESIVNRERTNSIGDFSGTSFDSWKSDGVAFGPQTMKGRVSFTSNSAQHHSDGYASSRYYNSGVFGVLRSPNFEIADDLVQVWVRGKNSTVRVVIDNFQLIRNPIYGDLEKKVNNEQWHAVEFNIGQWRGHKAYIEVLPGQNNTHVYGLDKESYIEIQAASTFTSTPPNRPFRPQITRHALTPSLRKLKLRSDSLSITLRDTVFVSGVVDGEAINSPVFNRGSHTDLSEENIPRSFLTALNPDPKPFTDKGSGRIEFAQNIVSKDNPLTSRVMVNRIWHHMFGRGIVETVDNFGMQGKLPSHPELLDHLALEFMESNWSVKSLIKSIALSETFRRSVGSVNDESIDPANYSLSHYPLRRLEAEAIRDQLLYVGGNLDLTLYGEPIPIHLNEFMNGRGKPRVSGPLDGYGRRSIYQSVRRNFLDPMMITFDRPIPFSTVGKRNVTNVPAQSLILMNDPFVKSQADLVSDKLLANTRTFEERLDFIYLQLFSRPATQSELEGASKFFDSMARTLEIETGQKESKEIWTEYCHSLFNLKEFIYLH